MVSAQNIWNLELSVTTRRLITVMAARVNNKLDLVIMYSLFD